MFRPSQALSFRAVPSLNKLKIHHPLPLGPRESQQLLNLLTTSFRHHLDTEHPIGPENGSSSSNPALLAQPKPRRRSTSELERNPAGRHMRSLLTNPLFGLPETKKIKSTQDPDPMVSFDRAVAAGMMNFRYAWACLNAKKRLLDNNRVKMGQSGAGFKALRWLVSSGEVSKGDFLKDHKFTPILMEFIVAEGLQEAAWPWIQRSLERIPTLSVDFPDALSRKTAYRDMVRPLLSLIQAEKNLGTTLDAAFMCLHKARNLLAGLQPEDVRKALRVPGKILIEASLQPFSKFEQPSEQAFDSFLSLMPIISPNSPFTTSQLHLIHPTRPSPTLALSHLRSIQGRLVNSRRLKSTRDENETIHLGLNTAKFLLKHGNNLEAEWVMEFLKAEFPKKLGIEESTEWEKESSDVGDIEFLRGLSIA